MYVGMHADIEIHSAAKSFVPQQRCDLVVGARSELMCDESATSIGSIESKPLERIGC